MRSSAAETAVEDDDTLLRQCGGQAPQAGIAERRGRSVMFAAAASSWTIYPRAPVIRRCARRNKFGLGNPLGGRSIDRSRSGLTTIQTIFAAQKQGWPTAKNGAEQPHIGGDDQALSWQDVG